MKNYTYNDEIYHAGVKGMKWSEEARARRRGRKRKDTGKTVDVRKRGDGLGGKSKANRYYQNNGDDDQLFDRILSYRNAAMSYQPSLRRNHLATDYKLRQKIGDSGYSEESRGDDVAIEKKRRQKVRTDAYKRGRAYSRIRGKKKAGRRMFTEK